MSLKKLFMTLAAALLTGATVTPAIADKVSAGEQAMRDIGFSEEEIAKLKNNPQAAQRREDLGVNDIYKALGCKLGAKATQVKRGNVIDLSCGELEEKKGTLDCKTSKLDMDSPAKTPAPQTPDAMQARQKICASAKPR